MATDYVTKIQDYVIDSCPKCGLKHTFKLKERVPKETVPIFGGPNERESLVTFTCPKTLQSFERAVPTPPEGEIEDVVPSTDVEQQALSTGSASPLDAEFTEWIKNSRTVALDFCKTMITISSGAIPVYFAVLKYLGFEKISGTQLGQTTIFPPILFLVALIVYALALRPTYKLVSEEDFPTFRKGRLARMNQFITAGTTIFVVATGLAIVIFFLVVT